MKVGLKRDLRMDFEAYLKHPKAPFFHKIKFASTNAYITKSNLVGLVYSENEYGCYRVFSWADPRAEEFLKLELGDEPELSPKLGIAKLIGRYKPVLDDLADIQYETIDGKAYFKSAKQALSETIIESSKNIKIDSKKFLKVNEIIPTGAQGKAIYGKGNYIIDGAAGTGKSTTVLQKIKILQNKNINTDNICVIVKNEKAIKGFEGLLDSIGISNLKIMTINNFFVEYFNMVDLVSYDSLTHINQYAINIFKSFKEATKTSERISLSKNILLGIDKEFEDIVSIDGILYELFIYYKNKCEAFKKIEVTIKKISKNDIIIEIKKDNIFKRIKNIKTKKEVSEAEKSKIEKEEFEKKSFLN